MYTYPVFHWLHTPYTSCLHRKQLMTLHFKNALAQSFWKCVYQQIKWPLYRNFHIFCGLYEILYHSFACYYGERNLACFPFITCGCRMKTCSATASVSFAVNRYTTPSVILNKKLFLLSPNQQWKLFLFYSLTVFEFVATVISGGKTSIHCDKSYTAVPGKLPKNLVLNQIGLGVYRTTLV